MKYKMKLTNVDIQNNEFTDIVIAEGFNSKSVLTIIEVLESTWHTEDNLLGKDIMVNPKRPYVFDGKIIEKFKVN